MKSILAALAVTFTGLGVSVSNAAVVLSGTSYQQNFDGIGSGLPNGWTVRTGASADNESPGSPEVFDTTPASWNDSAGGFKNFLSADQVAGNRALGIRQSDMFGDPGAAFVLEIPDTAGFENFSLSVKLQLLYDQSGSTTWTLQHRIGDSGLFTTLGTYPDLDQGGFGSTTASFNPTALSAWNNQSSKIWFRIVALTGTGIQQDLYDTFAIDDFSLTFSPVAPVPELTNCGLICAVGMLGVCALHTWINRRRASVQPDSAF